MTSRSIVGGGAVVLVAAFRAAALTAIMNFFIGRHS
jgi:hypothetical protein